MGYQEQEFDAEGELVSAEDEIDADFEGNFSDELAGSFEEQ